MNPRARIVLGALKAVFSPHFWRAVAANRRAARKGLPKPRTPGELVVEALELGAGATLPAVHNDKVREGIERGLDLLDGVDSGSTPTERPSAKHRGVR